MGPSRSRNKALFRFWLNPAVQLDSRGEVMADRPIGSCCIDRLSWHRISGVDLVQVLI
jgi:hypothetical protein